MKSERTKGFWRKGMSFLLCVPLAAGVLGGCTPEQEEPQASGTVQQSQVQDSAPVTFTGLGETVIADSYAANGLEKEIGYLLFLDADRLLANFYANSALGSNGASSYGGGWEGALIGGHTMGHYLSALAQAIANAGTPEEDRTRLTERLEYVVSELEKCQNNYDAEHGAKEGFLWGARVLNASNVELQFDNVEQGRADINTQAWVPWYTMHKIIAGLLDAYTLAGSERALSVVTKLGDWVYERVSGWTSSTQRTVLSIEYGGMNDCMYNLYAVTGEEKYAVAAHMFDEADLFEDVLMGNDNYLNGKHANTTIPKIIGALNRYLTADGKTIGGEFVDATEYLTVAEMFWERVTAHHTYITGGNSEWEHFGMDDVLDAERTNANCETCNTYNMLKLSRMLFSVTRDKKYLDFYENTYINAIWSSQNPDTGMTMYFQPMATGYFKVYSSEEEHFWCCTGSGMESFTKLNDSIYYDAGNATYVSLYVSSSYRSDGVALTQTADLENSDTVTLRVEEGSTVLRLRRPDWTAKFEVYVNGAQVEGGAQDGFVSVDVRAGDEVRVELEKTVTAHNLPDGENIYAFKYGPYVLSAELGTHNMTQGTTGVNVSIPAAAEGDETYTVGADSVQDFMADINAHMVRGEDGKFTLACENGTLTYSYHFRQHTQRYGIYFRFAASGAQEPEVTNPTNAWERCDTVQPGYGQYESDELHDMQTGGSQGVTSDGTYRYATQGGWFSYRMIVRKGVRNRLLVSFRKADNGKTIRITAGDTELYSATLDYAGDEAEYQVEVMIPVSVANGAQSVTANGASCDVLTFTFAGVDGAESAKVCTFLYTQALVNNLAYFVDCGDYDPTTVSEGDMLGVYNSVTEQVYGADAVTGMMWGIYDTHAANIAGTPAKGIGTNSTWANEYAAGDGVSKTQTDRYTKNQTENGVARNLHYKFQLPDGSYTVKVYFVDPWGVSKNPAVSAEGQVKLTGCAMDTELSFTVIVTDGTLDLDFTSSDLCINLAYIIIELAD